MTEAEVTTRTARIGNWIITLSPGDVLTVPTDLLICPCRPGDRHNSGLPRQIMANGGKDLEREINRKKEDITPFITGSYRLAMRRIASIYHWQLTDTRPETVAMALKTLLNAAISEKVQVLSLHSLQAASYKIPYRRLSFQLFTAFQDTKAPEPIRVQVTDSNPSFLNQLAEVLNAKP